MGCVLGPTYANFYMGHLEEIIFKNSNKPNSYCRYMDDIFITINNIEELENLKEKMENNSVLKVTYELESNKQLNFLDININNALNNHTTSVYIKKTNNGSCLNFISLCPLQYKIGTIKTFLHRAFVICSTWENFHLEVIRIKQLLINNNFPIYLIDKIINNFLKTKFEQNIINKSTSNENIIKIYFKGFMSPNHI